MNSKIEQIRFLLLQADLDLTKAIDQLHEIIKNKEIPADLGTNEPLRENPRIREVAGAKSRGKRKIFY